MWRTKSPSLPSVSFGALLLAAVLLFALPSPPEDTIGRSQKVGEEEIVGMVKAVELYLQEDHEALNKEWQRRLEYISAHITKVPGVTTTFPKLEIASL